MRGRAAGSFGRTEQIGGVVSQRSSWYVHGEFVPGHNGGSYTIVRLPLPPKGRVVRAQEESYPYDLVEWIELAVACPHCLEDVKFRYDTKKVSRSLSEEVIYGFDRSWSRARSEFDRRAEKLTAPHCDLLLQSMEDWYE